VNQAVSLRKDASFANLIRGTKTEMLSVAVGKQGQTRVRPTKRDFSRLPRGKLRALIH